jgi:adenylylsulfate kinase-like enzyme
MDYKLYWFTGQAGAGKTTLAHELKKHLEKGHIDKTIGKKYVIIDGDDIRELFSNSDYSVDGRKKQVDLVQKLCILLIKNKIIPIVCMVSPFAEQRKIFIDENNGYEIFVHTGEIRGREHYHVDYFEKPERKRNNVCYLHTDGLLDETMNTLTYILNI